MVQMTEIESALQRVIDPELGADIVDLGMVKVHEHGRRAFACPPVRYLDFQHRLGMIGDPGVARRGVQPILVSSEQPG